MKRGVIIIILMIIFCSSLTFAFSFSGFSVNNLLTGFKNSMFNGKVSESKEQIYLERDMVTTKYTSNGIKYDFLLTDVDSDSCKLKINNAELKTIKINSVLNFNEFSIKAIYMYPYNNICKIEVIGINLFDKKNVIVEERCLVPNKKRCAVYDDNYAGPTPWLQTCSGINLIWINEKECKYGCDNGACIDYGEEQVIGNLFVEEICIDGEERTGKCADDGNGCTYHETCANGQWNGICIKDNLNCPVEEGCIQESQEVQEGDKCCPDLTLISPTNFYEIEGQPTPADFNPLKYCSNCGDGVCSEPEDNFNCPDDCDGDIDVLMVTSNKLYKSEQGLISNILSKLSINYNDGYSKALDEYRKTLAEDNLKSIYINIDSEKIQKLFSLEPINTNDWISVKKALDKLTYDINPNYLIIIGGPDVIPEPEQSSAIPENSITGYDIKDIETPINKDEIYGDLNSDGESEFYVSRLAPKGDTTVSSMTDVLKVEIAYHKNNKKSYKKGTDSQTNVIKKLGHITVKKTPMKDIYKSKLFGQGYQYVKFLIYDIDKGIMFKAGTVSVDTKHIDAAPLTKKDTQNLRKIRNFYKPFSSWCVGGTPSNVLWQRRAVLVRPVNGPKDIWYAASVHGCPHGKGIFRKFNYEKGMSLDNYASSNNYPGHFCVHFLNSKTHGGKRIDKTAQKMIAKAYKIGTKLDLATLEDVTPMEDEVQI